MFPIDLETAKAFARLFVAKAFADLRVTCAGHGIFHTKGNVMRELGSAQPTAVELEILRILWELGPSPVRDIHARLNESKGTNYSTSVKMLSVMLTKGLVKRDESASPHIYRAAMTRDRAAKGFLNDLIEKVYNGSAMSLVLQALASGKASKEEIDEARRLLDQMDAKR
jgi:predicted transcriptional regulator